MHGGRAATQTAGQNLLNETNASTYPLVFAVTLVAALLLTPAIRRLSLRWGVVAEPGGRRRHEGSIPKLGGLAIFIAWLIGVALIYRYLPPVEADDATRLRGLLLGSLDRHRRRLTRRLV